MSERIPFENYLLLITSFYTETDEDSRNEINTQMITFENDYPTLSLQYCIKIIDSYDGDNEQVLTLAALVIKRFFTISYSRSEQLITNEWNDFDDSDKHLLYSVLKNRSSDPQESLRNTIIAASAALCYFDKQFYDSFSTDLKNIITEPQTIEDAIVALSFFSELLDTSFFQVRASEPEIPETINFLIFQVIPWFFQNYDVRLRILSLKISSSLIQCFPELCQELIQEILNGAHTALETISHFEQPVLHSDLYSFIYTISVVYYDQITAMWPSLKPLVLDTLVCSDPENQDAHSSKQFHEVFEPVLLYWLEMSQYELSLQKVVEEKQGLVNQVMGDMIPLLLHILEPYNPEDPNIEDSADPQTSFYASMIFDNFCMINNEKVFEFILPVLQTIQGSFESAQSLTPYHLFTSLIASLAKGERTEQIAAFFDDAIIPFFINAIPQDQFNYRLKESAVYALYNIMKQHSPLEEAEFGAIITFIKETSMEPMKLRERFSDLLRVIVSNIDNPLLIDAFYDTIFELVMMISGFNYNETTLADNFYKPFNIVFTMIMKCSQSEENFAKIIDYISSNMEHLKEDTNIQFNIALILMMGAAAKKFGGVIQQTQATQNVIQWIEAILSSLDRNHEVDLWQESFLTILYCLDIVSLDPSYFETFKGLIDNARDSEQLILIVGSIRIFGKFISTSFDEAYYPEIEQVIDTFDQWIDYSSQNADGATGLGIALALAEISKPLIRATPVNSTVEPIRPPPELVEKILIFADKLSDFPPCDGISKIISAVLVIYSNVFQGAERSEFESIAKRHMRPFIRFVGNIYKASDVITKEIIINGSTALVYAGRAFQKRVNTMLNSTRIINFVKLGVDSDDSSLSEFCRSCLEEIKKL